jgi:hypothetical protein
MRPKKVASAWSREVTIRIPERSSQGFRSQSAWRGLTWLKPLLDRRRTIARAPRPVHFGSCGNVAWALRWALAASLTVPSATAQDFDPQGRKMPKGGVVRPPSTVAGNSPRLPLAGATKKRHRTALHRRPHAFARVWKRQDSLAQRYRWQHLFYKVRCRLRHHRFLGELFWFGRLRTLRSLRFSPRGSTSAQERCMRAIPPRLWRACQRFDWG